MSLLFFSFQSPIALRNAIYKIISKVLSTRICLVLDSVVGNHQSAFNQDRQSCDNIIIAHEIMTTMNRKRLGKHGSMILKVDMSNAFDRAKWCFINLMLGMGFPNKFLI